MDDPVKLYTAIRLYAQDADPVWSPPWDSLPEQTKQAYYDKQPRDERIKVEKKYVRKDRRTYQQRKAKVQ